MTAAAEAAETAAAGEGRAQHRQEGWAVSLQLDMCMQHAAGLGWAPQHAAVLVDCK
jgi:hypothetical protein